MNASGNSNETLSSQRNVVSAHSWEAFQNALAEENGLAILLVDGAQPPALAVSYNNSICRMMQSSEMHEHLCEPFCGKAFDNAVSAGETIAYRCHAGLQCLAAPLKTDENMRPLVAIVGRAFVKTSDYRALTTRVFEGDLQDLPAEELLQNVLLVNSQSELERLALRLQSLGEEEEEALFELTSQLNTNFQHVEYETESNEVADVENVKDIENVRDAEDIENTANDELVEVVEDVKSLPIQEETVLEDKPQTVETKVDKAQPEPENEEDLLSEITRSLPDPRKIGLALESLSNVLRGAKGVRNNQTANLAETVETVDNKSVENKSVDDDKSLTEIAANTENNLNKIESSTVETSDELTEIGDSTSGDNVLIVENTADEMFADKHQNPVVSTNITPINFSEIADDLAAWQNFTGSLMRQTFREASVKTLQFLAGRFHLTALAWLEKWEDWLQATLATGRLQNEPMRIGLEVTDERLREAVSRETAVKLEKRLPNGEAQVIELFPLAISDEIKAAIVVGDAVESEEIRIRIARFCRNVTLPLEVLRLREEIEKGSRSVSAVQLFSEKLTSDEIASSENAFDYLTKVSAEILRAERSSLLVYDEDDNYLKAKAAFGVRDEVIKQQIATGERVASQVWNDGKTSLVKNVELSGLPPASAERGYKSNSFISFPIFVGTRKIGVLNITDKIGGEDYDENDVRLLESIAPSLAIALDRALLQQKAGKFEVLSITDALTGLLNRRYLEERLAEELKRSHRHGYPMSFMMIDVDNFKRYNDSFGHVAGDEALQVTARCLKAALRGADVAARFGGEEFSILLPQTTLSEANAIAERIRRRVETTTFAHGRVTVSIGIAAFSQRFDTPQAFIKAADTALYEAKKNGKNAVRLWKHAETSTANSF